MRLVLLLSVAGAVFAQGPGRIRLIYAVSGKPAAGVAVQVSRDGRSAQYTSDSAGRIGTTVASGLVFISDPKTGTVLLSRSFSAEPTEIEIGMPIKVTGQVTGFGSDPGKVEIDCAYGDRMPVSDYERTVQKLDLRPRANQDTVHGMALPQLPGKSLRMHPDASGRFTTEWFAAMAAPELLVFGGPDGRTGTKTVKLARNIRPGATVSAGSIAPSFGATLEIKVNAPKTDLPLGLLMGVESLTPSAAAKTRTAELLSTIHRQNVNLSQFLLKRRTIPLNFEGVTTLTGLPPIESLKLAFNGPTVGIRAERTVKIPQSGVVRIELPAEELLGKQQPRVPYSGVVRFAGGAGPVAGAKVVYSSYPDKYETTSGPDGRFHFDGVPANRAGILFFDAPNPGGVPPFDRLTISRPVAAIAPAPAAAAQQQEFEIPKPHPSAIQIPPPLEKVQVRTALGAGLLGDFNYKFNNCKQGYSQADLEFDKGPVVTIWKDVGEDDVVGPINAVWGKAVVNEDGSGFMQINFPEPGKYEVYFELTPFVFSVLHGEVINEPAQNLFFPAPSNFEVVGIQVIGKNKNPAPANVEVTFGVFSPDLDPFEILTDANGQFVLGCVTLSSLPELQYLAVHVDDPVSGYFDAELPLPQTITGPLVIQLADKPSNTATRTSKK
jgi:hypothetical protein